MIPSYDPEEEASENRSWKLFGSLLIVAAIVTIIFVVVLVVTLLPYILN